MFKSTCIPIPNIFPNLKIGLWKFFLDIKECFFENFDFKNQGRNDTENNNEKYASDQAILFIKNKFKAN